MEIISISGKLNQKLKFQLISMEVVGRMWMADSNASAMTPCKLCNSQGNAETV